MLLKVDHYTALARTVARLERDSYEVRGAVYDRALTALVKRLHAADPPHSQVDIDMELLAFREAVRRVEFGDIDDHEWLAQQSEPMAEPEPQAASLDAPQVLDAPPVVPGEPIAEPSQNARELVRTPRPRSVFGRVAGRMVFAVVLIGLGIAGYAHATGQLDLAPLTRLFDQLAALDWPGQGSQTSEGPRLMDMSGATERATYYEQAGADSAWRQLAGKAAWRTRIEGAGAGRKPEAVLILDVQVPERGLSMAMSVRRDAGEDAAMSHLIEFQFAGTPDFPVAGLSGVMGISLKNAEDRSATALAGQSVKVAPGVFLFGLSADKDDARRNIELLKTQSQLDIPVAFADGRTGIIAIEKGASGERVFDDVFKKWAQ